ncbi:hypothetical protein CEXT_274721 [Caerostris extrusa]|uniref:Uncharacterized protein n=1 Tax=Caerostris extrusa TaxID=172846 RepID=A0AAV4RBM2_CAEEX|nr:hypothetical protein CEXT_274721 [Caerostris extrusa]
MCAPVADPNRKLGRPRSRREVLIGKFGRTATDDPHPFGPCFRTTMPVVMFHDINQGWYGAGGVQPEWASLPGTRITTYRGLWGGV